MTRIAQKPKPFRVGSIRRRFGAVLLSLVSLAALGVVVLLPPWCEMQQAQAARRAAEPFLAARRLIEPLLEYRRVAGEWVARTGRTDSQQLTRHTEQVEALLHALESTVCQPGFAESRSAVTTLRSEWEAVRHQITQWSQTGEFRHLCGARGGSVATDASTCRGSRAGVARSATACRIGRRCG
jgi:predicted nucleic acid-binding Zn ribbon protein